MPFPSLQLRRSGAVALAATALCSAAKAQPEIHPEELELKPRIDAAIEKGVDALIQEQFRDGSWGVHGRHLGGKAALCAYTLLKCGLPPDHPSVRRAFAYLDSIDPSDTYSTGLMLLAYGARQDAELERRMEVLAYKMLEFAKTSGDWGYPDNQPDLSNTQYAALGLWAADKAGIRIPPRAWMDLIEIMFRYQQEPTLVDAPPAPEGSEESRRTSSGKILVAGYSYRKGQRTYTGSMTTAGVSVLQICKIGLGKRLGGRARQRVDQAIEQGMNWLGVNFSVDKNPNNRGHLYYYLYGLERAGSLTRREQVGNHWWYIDGAKFLLGKQNGQGHWPGGTTQTCFALLFLRRATRADQPTTGVGGRAAKHVFAAGGPDAEVSLRGAGQAPLALWIDGFGDELKARHEQYGIRVLEVLYEAGDVVLGKAAGDPVKPWANNDTYVVRTPVMRRGTYDVQATVRLVAADAPPGVVDRIVEVRSKPMKVEISEVFEDWMETAARMRLDNQLRALETAVRVTTNDKEAARITDGRDDTHWVCEPSDEAPAVEIDIGASVRADRILIAQPPRHQREVGRFDQIRVVDVWINRDRDPIRIELDKDPLAVTDHELPDTRRISRLRVQIVRRDERSGKAGFAEIGLARRGTRRRR